MLCMVRQNGSNILILQWCILMYFQVFECDWSWLQLFLTPGTFLSRPTNHRFTRKTALQASQKVDLRYLIFKFRIRSFLEENTHTHTNAESLVECLEMQSLAEECHLFPSRGHGLVRSLRSPERGCQQCLGLSAVYS